MFDRYDIGFQIAKLVAYSNEPLEEIKYIQHVLKQLYELYKIKNDIDKDAMMIEGDAKRIVAVDTGRLRSSINTIKQPLIRRIGSSVVYAAAQEFGRPDMKQYTYRPYLRPAARMNKPKIEAMMKKEIEK